MNQGKYEGDLTTHCHEELAEKIQAIANMTIQQKVCKHMGERIYFDIVSTGGCKNDFGVPGYIFRYFIDQGETIRIFYADEGREEIYLCR